LAGDAATCGARGIRHFDAPTILRQRIAGVRVVARVDAK
jgi:hypothetical protein